MSQVCGGSDKERKYRQGSVFANCKSKDSVRSHYTYTKKTR